MDSKEARETDDRRHLGSPYGPHPHGTDEAAGGADSSPHETDPTGERVGKAKDIPRKPADQINPPE